MKKVIKSHKHSKAPGYDTMTFIMIKKLPCHCVSHLVTVYNSALRLQHFPDSWKKAEVVTIPKKGKDPKILQNRRTISLLSCLGKVYERILLNRLNSQVIANSLVPDEQFGFMPGRLTTTQVDGVHNIWT